MNIIIKIMFIVIPIFIGLTMIVTITMIISPKFKGYLMSRQIKSIKHMTDYSKKDIEDIEYNIYTTSIDAENKIVNDKYSEMENIYTKKANAKKEALSATSKTIKEELLSTYCKYCKEKIPIDSNYCNKCGKKQKN